MSLNKKTLLVVTIAGFVGLFLLYNNNKTSTVNSNTQTNKTANNTANNNDNTNLNNAPTQKTKEPSIQKTIQKTQPKKQLNYKKESNKANQQKDNLLITDKNNNNNQTSNTKINEKNNNNNAKQQQCLKLSSIVLQDYNYSGKSLIISKKQQKHITQKYLNKCIKGAVINKIMAEVTNWYVANGYTTTRIYLPNQNVFLGELLLLVLEGKIADIYYTNNTWYNNIRLFMAFPNIASKNFNMKDVEQGLEQLNRLPSNTATIVVHPAKKEGESNIEVINQPHNRFRGSVTVNNAYSRKHFKDAQVSAKLEADNLLFLNEKISTDIFYSPPKVSVEKNITNATNIDIPFGYANLGYTFSNTTAFNQSILEDGLPSLYRVYTNKHALNFAYLLYRNKLNKLTLNSNGSYTNQRTYLDVNNDATLALLSQTGKTTTIDFSFTYSSQNNKGYYSVQSGMEFGTKLLGAKRDNQATAYEDGHRQFYKYTLNSSLCYGLNLFGLQYCGNLNAQFSNITLLSKDQIGLGGSSSVRGYNDYNYFADSGLYLQNDLTLPLSYNGNNFILKTFFSTSLYTALDIGYGVKKHQQMFGSKPMDGEFLSGLAWGIKNNSKWLTYKFQAAIPLYYSRKTKPIHAISKEKYDIDYAFNFTIKLF